MVISKKLTVGPNRRQTGLLQESLALGKCSRQLHLYQSDFETNNDDTGQAEGRKAEYSWTRPELKSKSNQQRTINKLLPKKYFSVYFIGRVYCEEVHSLLSTKIKRGLKSMHLHLPNLSSKTFALNFKRCAIYPRCAKLQTMYDILQW